MNSILRSSSFPGFRKGLLLFAMVFFAALVPSLIGHPVEGVVGDSSRANAVLSVTAPVSVGWVNAAPLQAGGTFEISPSVIAGGGGTSLNGSTRLDGTIGQSILGASSGGTFSVLGGFWQSGQAPAATIKILGDITYCLGTNHFPINNVTVGITGPPNDSPVTNPSGHYQSVDLSASLTYTLVPSRTEPPLPPASTGFSVLDVIRMRQIILNNEEPTLSTCEKAAAEVNGSSPINVLDVIAERQFILGTAAGNVGKWAFGPSSDAVISPIVDATKNFGAVRVGDLNGDWPGPGTGPSGQSFPTVSGVSAASSGVAGLGGSSDAPIAVNSVSLPLASVAVATAPPGSTTITNFASPVMISDTTGNRITGFQGDFILNNTTIADVDNPIAEAANLTVRASWSVSASVIATVGNMKTIRVLVDSDGAVAHEINSGQGVLFNLKFVRVSSTPGASTSLTWVPGSFVFSSNLPAGFVIPDNLANGSITIGGTPTAVRFSSFKAIGYDNGVHLNWQTGFEAENLGFNIYREVAGQRSLVNPDIIAGSALMAGTTTKLQAGQSYGWWDNTGDSQRNAQYWIEEIDLNGLRTMHGPFGVRHLGGRPQRESQAELLSHVGRGEASVHQLPLSFQTARSGSLHTEAATLAAAPKLSALPALKLTIREEGWYRVTQQELAAAGFDTGRNPRNLQLYVNGVEQSIRVVGEQDGRADAIEFFATGQDKATTDAHVYWLVSGDAAGSRIGVFKSEGKSGGMRSFPFTAERRDRTVYFSSLRNGDAENFFGQVVTSRPVDQLLTLRHLDTTSSDQAEVEVALQGVTDQARGHSVRVLVNGLQVGTLVFGGQNRKAQKFAIGRDVLKEGDNVVTLAAEVADSDVSLVDYIRVTYPHSYTSDQDSLRMSVASSSQTIEGFGDGSVRVFDITDTSAPIELAGKIVYQGGSYVVSLEMAGQGTRTLLALTDNRIKTPASVALNEPSNWGKKSKADLLIITRSEFFSALEPLKALRESQGMRVQVVDIADIFDEFSDGERTPQAVRDFLSTATTKWKRKPAFVLFAGHASLDPRNHLGFGDSDIVPTKLIDTGLMETASDDWFVDFNDDGLPELAVGRLPFRTQSEAVTMVSKILSYERSLPANQALLVADANDGFDFEAASGQVGDMLPISLKLNRIDRGRVDAAVAKTALIDAINRGQTIVNYIGHGSVNQWKGNLLTNDDARALINGDHLSLFVMMTCLNGYFQDAALDSLAESLLKAERGGAVAVWASSGMTDPSDQAPIDRQLYMSLFGTGVVKGQTLTLGEAIMRAKAASGDPDVRRTWVLLGDPSMRIK